MQCSPQGSSWVLDCRYLLAGETACFHFRGTLASHKDVTAGADRPPGSVCSGPPLIPVILMVSTDPEIGETASIYRSQFKTRFRARDPILLLYKVDKGDVLQWCACIGGDGCC